jgi:hypothetical protein
MRAPARDAGPEIGAHGLSHSRGGEPLDQATRSSIEPRLGVDLGGVRIHADAEAAGSAATLGARAYTVGRDVFFGASEYQPRTAEGRFLLAHELTHVAQQRGAGVGEREGETESFEAESSRAAVRVMLGGHAHVAPASGAPALQMMKISAGGFGTALERYTNERQIPDAVVKLLLKSSSFMSMVAVLDKHYVSYFDAMDKYWATGPWTGKGDSVDGILQFGPPGVMGKPALAIQFPGGSAAGAEFRPVKSAGGYWAYDIIALTGETKTEFIQQIIHETGHAYRAVTGANPAAVSLDDVVKAGIEDEIAVRKIEARGLKEVPDKDVSTLAANVGALDRRDVERDIAAAAHLTYLELFFFGFRLQEERNKENLTDTQVRDIQNAVTANPDAGIFYQVSFPLGDLSDYAWIWRKRTICAREWTDFFQKNKASDPGFAAKKEKLLQDHATRFFEGKISYTP